MRPGDDEEVFFRIEKLTVRKWSGTIVLSNYLIYEGGKETMRFSKTSKKVLSVALTAVVAVGALAVPAPKKADAASYKAALCMQTTNYYCRDVLSNKNTCKGIKLKTGAKIAGTSATDKTFKKGKFNFTVSLSGFNKAKGAKAFNFVSVNTTLPGKNKSKLKNVKLVVKVDGKTVKTIKNPAMEPQKGTNGYVSFLVMNAWNSEAKKKCTSVKMPKKTMSVTVTGQLK